MTDNRPANAIVHGECGQWWTGASRVHCAGCHQTFSSESAADKHRTGRYGGDRRCVSPLDAGLVAREKPWGACWSMPGLDGDAWFKNADAA